MVLINWRDIILKALPLIPTIIMYVASYRLSIAKNAKEEKQDQFERLSEENERLTRELAKKDKKIEELQEEIYEAKVAALVPTTSNQIERKDEKNHG